MILLTGASGFVGGALCSILVRQTSVRVAVRNKGMRGIQSSVEMVEAKLSAEEDWSEALRGADCIVHCAARVHVMNDKAANPLAEFRRINVAGTLSLAKQAADMGVKRFVFLSSIKVNGEQTLPGLAYTADQFPNPCDPYGISKMEAEDGLRVLANETGMEMVIIRPPLVYGPGVKANFLAMMRWLSRGVPLPLGAVTENRRSLVGLDNLVDLIIRCIDHPAAANQTFLVSDGEDLSTAELLRRMGQALGRPARLVPVPMALLKAGAAVLGRGDVAQRLCGSLQVDITKTRELLDWSPPASVDEGLRRTAEHWIRSQDLSHN